MKQRDMMRKLFLHLMVIEQGLSRLTLKRSDAAMSSESVIVKIGAQTNTHHDSLQMEFVEMDQY